jgi:predicted benzoate:H+ symporter BenE
VKKSENLVYDNAIMMLPRQLLSPLNGYALHSSILKDVWLDLKEGQEDEKRVELLITNVTNKQLNFTLCNSTRPFWGSVKEDFGLLITNVKNE